MSTRTNYLFAAVITLMMCATGVKGQISITITANVPPPALPVYAQPPCPAEGYLWMPGYWGYADGTYFWVPGVWVMPPQPGYLWTPPYWGYENGVYGFYDGYWGPDVGFYGGVNYGYGYSGTGFSGGRWEGNNFRYNTAVLNVNKTVIHNTYVDRTVVIHNTTNNRISYDGGPHGLSARPGPQEQAALRERHVAATADQQHHVQQARSDKNQWSTANHGRPAKLALNKPGGQAYQRPVNRTRPAGNPTAATPRATTSQPHRNYSNQRVQGTRPARPGAAVPANPDQNSRPATPVQPSRPPASPLPNRANRPQAPVNAQNRGSGLPATSAPRPANEQPRPAPQPAGGQRPERR